MSRFFAVTVRFKHNHRNRKQDGVKWHNFIILSNILTLRHFLFFVFVFFAGAGRDVRELHGGGRELPGPQEPEAVRFDAQRAGHHGGVQPGH